MSQTIVRNAPVVSVVMPTFNSSAFVAEAIGSVRAQTFEDWELLIIDDCSADDTVARVRDVATGDSRIRVSERATNGGPARARNQAIGMASGRYVSFLDSDDLWYPAKLERQLGVLAAEGVPLVFSSYDVGHVSHAPDRTIVARPEVRHDDFLKGNAIGCLTAIYDTRMVGRLEMPDLRLRQDWGLWLRVLQSGHRAVGIQEPLAFLRQRKGSITRNKLRASYYTWRILREEGGLGPVAAGVGVVTHVYRSLRRNFGGARV